MNCRIRLYFTPTAITSSQYLPKYIPLYFQDEIFIPAQFPPQFDTQTIAYFAEAGNLFKTAFVGIVSTNLGLNLISSCSL